MIVITCILNVIAVLIGIGVALLLSYWIVVSIAALMEINERDDDR